MIGAVFGIAICVCGLAGGITYQHLHPGWRYADMLHQFLLPLWIAGGMVAGGLAAALTVFVVGGLVAAGRRRSRVAGPVDAQAGWVDPQFGANTVQAGDGFAWSLDRVAGGTGHIVIGDDVDPQPVTVADARPGAAEFLESVMRDIDAPPGVPEEGAA